MSEKTYLGDGVYASYNGYQIILEANVPTTNRIVLDNQTYNALIQYAERLSSKPANDPGEEDER